MSSPAPELRLVGPPWSNQRWKVPSTARLLTTVDENGQPRGSEWYVPYGESWEIPVGFEYSGTGPFNWTMWVQILDGAARCVDLRCWSAHGGRVTAGALRKLPIGRLVEEGVLLVSRPWDEIPKKLIRWPSVAEARRQREQVAQTHRHVTRSPRHRAPITDELLRKVASIYRDALAGGRPTAEVAERLSYSRASAGRLVMEARRRGFLPQTNPRQAHG